MIFLSEELEEYYKKRLTKFKMGEKLRAKNSYTSKFDSEIEALAQDIYITANKTCSEEIEKITMDDVYQFIFRISDDWDHLEYDDEKSILKEFLHSFNEIKSKIISAKSKIQKIKIKVKNKGAA